MTIESDMLKWLHDNETPEAVEVLRYEEAEKYGPASYCSFGTCWDDYTVVEIFYRDRDGNEDSDWYEGELTEFIRELTNN